MEPDVGVDGKGEVEHGGALWEGQQLALGREHLEGIHLRVTQHILHAQILVPLVVVQQLQIALIVSVQFFMAALPTGENAGSVDLVHLVGHHFDQGWLATDKHLRLQGLIAVGLGIADVVPDAVGHHPHPHVHRPQHPVAVGRRRHAHLESGQRLSDGSLAVDEIGNLPMDRHDGVLNAPSRLEL